MMYEESVDVRGGTMEEAVSVLQRRVNKYKNEGFVESWSLKIMTVHRFDYNHIFNNRDDEQDQLWWWDRFLTMLSQESSKTQLECIELFGSSLERPNDEVLKRLFRDVLPNLTLASVKKIEFISCHIRSSYINMFLTSFSNNNNNNNANLCDLRFICTKLHSSSVAAIAQLLSCGAKNGNGNGNGPPIEKLYLTLRSIDSTGCELILNALDGNTCLQILDLKGNGISEIGRDAAKALGKCKNLYSLDLSRNPLSEQSFCHLAEGLRTNLSLKRLGIGARRSRVAKDAFAELLETFNYSLQEVSWTPEDMNKVLLQNTRIRRLLGDLLERNCNSSSNTTTSITTTGRCYHLPQLYLWPFVLECIGSKPSLIYCFVRQSNLQSFTTQVLSLLAGSRNKNKNSNSIVVFSKSKKNNPPKRSRIA